MRKASILSGLLMVSGLSLAVFSQTKTVTNADLEQYRQQRLAAERDLRENYEALGFSSPEERAKREAESRDERARIVKGLKERDAAREASRQTYQRSAQPVFPYPNPSFVDYGGRHAPSYYYYRFYDPFYRRTGKQFGRGTYGRGYYEPRRFRTFRRMWKNATRRSDLPGRGNRRR